MPAFAQGARYWGHTSLSVSAGNVTPFTGIPSATIVTLMHTASAVRIRLDGVTAHSGTGLLLGPNATGILTFIGGALLGNINIICTGPTGFIEASWGNVE